MGRNQAIALPVLLVAALLTSGCGAVQRAGRGPLEGPTHAAPQAAAPGGAPEAAARASEPSTPPKGEAVPAPEATDDSAPVLEPARRWYGWQIIGVDALAITGVALALAREDAALGGASAGLFLAGPLAVHLLNGRSGNAGRSVAARLLVPLAGGGAGMLIGLLVSPFIDCGSGDSVNGLCALDGVAYGGPIGLVVGAAAAAVYDAGFVAYEPLEEEVDADQQSGLTLVPSTGVTVDGNPTFGLAGRF